jgi:hypothetical protein
MRTLAIITALGISLAAVAAGQKSGSQTPSGSKPAAAPKAVTPASAEDDLKAPMAGAPARGTRGRMEPAASRGVDGEHCNLEAGMNFTTVAPVNSVAFTATAQPVLLWYVGRIPSCPVVFTLTVDSDDRPLAEKEIAVTSAGLQEVRLTDLDVRLQPGTMYRWFVSLVPDMQRRSRDLISGALLRYEPGDTGAWHDRLSSVYARADSPAVEQELRTLLQDAGLTELARQPHSPHR